jgi:hypothetical protein
MPKALKLEGQVFGRLTVVSRTDNNGGHAAWLCLCSCGVETVVTGWCLVSGHTQSCGCLHRERITVHGKNKSSEYRAWEGMIQRCTNPKNKRYSDYGGRGITVCPEWFSFENFYRDMGDRPSKDHSIDRIDNNGNYCKENCKWSTRKEQGNNRRSNRSIEFNGEVRTLIQWSEFLGIAYHTLRRRLREGWSIERAFTEGVE